MEVTKQHTQFSKVPDLNIPMKKNARIDLTEMLHFQVKSEEAKYGLIMGKGFPFRQVN